MSLKLKLRRVWLILGLLGFFAFGCTSVPIAKNPKRDTEQNWQGLLWQAEKAQHYILSYEFNKDKQIFKAEVYYKNYDNLVVEKNILW